MQKHDEGVTLRLEEPHGLVYVPCRGIALPHPNNTMHQEYWISEGWHQKGRTCLRDGKRVQMRVFHEELQAHRTSLQLQQ